MCDAFGSDLEQYANGLDILIHDQSLRSINDIVMMIRHCVVSVGKFHIYTKSPKVNSVAEGVVSDDDEGVLITWKYPAVISVLERLGEIEMSVDDPGKQSGQAEQIE